MKTRTAIAISAALFLAVCRGSGQTAPAQAVPNAATAQTKIEPTKEAEIRRLLDLNNSRQNFLDSVELLARNVQSFLTGILPPGDYRSKLTVLAYEKCEFKMKMDIEHLIDMAVSVYDKYFSSEEIEHMVKLYETPAGKKTIALVPETANEFFNQIFKGSGAFWLGFVKKTLADDPKMAEGFGLRAEPGQQKPSIPANFGVPPNKIAPEKEAKIRHLLDITGALKMKPDVQPIIQMIRNSPSSPFPDTKYRAQLTELYIAYLSENIVDYASEIAISVDDKYFSSAEIDDLIEFFETPTGKKIASGLPEFAQELAGQASQWGTELAKLCLQEVLVEHPDLAEAFQKAANGAPPK